jgi:mannose-6-phosphate isomerase-like protein (cupin superfamily)
MLGFNSNREAHELPEQLLMNQPKPISPALVRHESDAPKERSTCGWRHLLISRQDRGQGVAAWAHAVDIDGAREHYHKRSTELYYVLEGEGTVRLDGVDHPVRKGSMVHIPPGVVHGAAGRVRVLVVGIPDIAEDDLFFPESPGLITGEK